MLHVSRDGGKTWTDPGKDKPTPKFTECGKGEGTIAGIHAKVAELNDGRLLAFGRMATIDGKMPGEKNRMNYRKLISALVPIPDTYRYQMTTWSRRSSAGKGATEARRGSERPRTAVSILYRDVLEAGITFSMALVAVTVLAAPSVDQKVRAEIENPAPVRAVTKGPKFHWAAFISPPRMAESGAVTVIPVAALTVRPSVLTLRMKATAASST